MAQEFAILGKFTGKLSRSKARGIVGSDFAKKDMTMPISALRQFNASIRDMRKF